MPPTPSKQATTWARNAAYHWVKDNFPEVWQSLQADAKERFGVNGAKPSP